MDLQKQDERRSNDLASAAWEYFSHNMTDLPEFREVAEVDGQEITFKVRAELARSTDF